MIYGCAPLLNGSAGGEIKVVARDRKVREKSSGVWSVEYRAYMSRKMRIRLKI